jgi:hypothetical protein
MYDFLAVGISLPCGARGEVRTVCPQCSPWRRKSRLACLAVHVEQGVWHCHHCGWSGRFLGRPSPVSLSRPLPQVLSESRIACAPPSLLDRVYRTLLAGLSLSAVHRQALHHRGINDREIVYRGYRTFPVSGRAALAKRLVEEEPGRCTGFARACARPCRGYRGVEGPCR